MLNFVHTFGATKKEFKGKGEPLAPSAPYAGTTEGTCAEIPYISVFYKIMAPEGGTSSVYKASPVRFRPQLLR
jgi:hypothetical protein